MHGLTENNLIQIHSDIMDISVFHLRSEGGVTIARALPDGIGFHGTLPKGRPARASLPRFMSLNDIWWIFIVTVRR